MIPVGAARITPDTLASYTGQALALAATVLDTFGNALGERAITWTSTSTAHATVEGDGVVTARAPGSATIIAASEGKADTASLTILARPTADWTAATGGWGTFQGNAAHTGYVPAVVDPVGFAKRWEATVAEQSAFGLNQAVAGAGLVFVTNDVYFGQQRLVALDVATGMERWSQDFGTIHSVDPPAYADGVV